MSLSRLVSTKVLSLRSVDSKVHYTKEENGLCQQLISAVAKETDLFKVKKTVTVAPDVMELLNVVAAEGNTNGISNILRQAFNGYTASVVKHNAEQPDKQISGFPKVREYSSVTIMFRSALKELGATQETIDAMFPGYQKKDKQAE